MSNLFGWLFFLIIFLTIFLSNKSNKHLNLILLTSFLVRFFLVLLDHSNLIILPDSTADAKFFDLKALEFSRNQGFSVVLDFFKSDSLLISRIISIFYTIFGESIILAQSISVAVGTASIYLIYKVCLILWDSRSATKAAWVAAMFPSLILYSCLTLREVYIVFFLLCGLLAIIKYMKNETAISFIGIFIIFYILTLFHGASSIGLFVFLLFLILSLIKEMLFNLLNLKIKIKSFLFFVISLVPAILLLTQQLKIPYLPNIFDLDTIIYEANIVLQGDARYSELLVIKSNDFIELFFKMILKSFYFLYSPFIWNIDKPYHLVGFFDAILYFILTIYLIKNWSALRGNPVLQIFFFMLVSYIIIHGMGVGNFGTGIRHRSKFAVMFIILIAPKINTFILSRRNI